MFRSIAALILALTAFAAQAETISYVASGTLSDSGGLGPTPFPNGTPISINFAIDAATPDADPDPNFGFYSGLTGTFTLGGQTYSIDSYGFRSVSVINDFSYSTGSGDQIQIRAWTSNFSSVETPVFNGASLHRLTLVLASATASSALFSGDVLTNTLGLGPAAITGARFGMQAGDLVYINSDAVGPATGFSSTLVPIPAAVWLFGSSLGVIGWMRRKVAI